MWNGWRAGIFLNSKMKAYSVNDNIAVVFNMFETGLGIARSLGQKGIKVIGVDHKKDIASYSRYVKPLICPHPLKEKEKFLRWIDLNFKLYENKIPALIASDDFLIAFAENNKYLSGYFLFNMIAKEQLDKITDKYCQYELAKRTGIQLPRTAVLRNVEEIDRVDFSEFSFPVFLKGLDVNLWREHVSSTAKGFSIPTLDDLHQKASHIVGLNLPVIVQEIIQGPDSNHFKYNVYIGHDGEIKAEFTLRKIRQNPIRFGVGSVVESIQDDELIAEGRKLFQGINFTGIGSAEFKREDKNGLLKLIEINPRYWQQNYLSTVCGINFPYINYCDLKEISLHRVSDFKNGIKWVNRYMDFDSFLKYWQKGELSFSEWRKSLKGKKVYSDFKWNDPLPALYEIGFGKKIFNIPGFLIKHFRR
jgi:D-aspartate ligase